MTQIARLRSELKNISAIHDTPIGLIHPYWARKPMNVVSTLIKHLSKPSDIICDPFMGSGTTVFAAISCHRSVVGTDINPLSVSIVKSILALRCNSKEILIEINKINHEISSKLLGWYKISPDEYVERERYEVQGDFNHGKFKLVPVELVVKKIINNKWIDRRVINLENNKTNYSVTSFSHQYLHSPTNFENIDLMKNSRIAIPAGAKLSHFYTNKNIASINYAVNLINNKRLSNSVKNAYRLIISSSLPLLRLSDKKASSQWPYWRPKKMLTSRNPVMVFQKREQALRDAIQWIEENIPPLNINKIYKSKEKAKLSKDPSVLVKQCAIQELKSIVQRDGSFDLVLTDPPYSDHIPYLEYSALWIKTLGLTLPSKAFKQEIVKSDSPCRQTDSKDYINRLGQSFDICCKLVKKEGYVVWFYQDWDLNHWSIINRIAINNNMAVADIIPLFKQRRSMKTVASPGTTLDGDLICIFQKKDNLKVITQNNFDHLKKQLSRELSEMRKQSLFDKYAFIIEFCLKNHCIDALISMQTETKSALKILSEG